MPLEEVTIGSARLIRGDCCAILPTLGFVDAIVTDPPYGLKFMGKRWDDPGSFVERFTDKTVKFDKIGGNHNPINSEDLARTRRVEGVRQQEWHSQWARVAYSALKPGGYLLAFGGSRTHHRIWCAIEDAGFVLQDTIMWLYGQGFPKGRTQLKPAFEPICVAYKPGGPRALQIDKCRIPIDGSGRPARSVAPLREGVAYAGNSLTGRVDGSLQSSKAVGLTDLGRWPANVCHDGSDEVMEAFAAFGDTPTGGIYNKQSAKRQSGFAFGAGSPRDGYSDRGTAGRFFYCAKASKADRAGSKHPTVKPMALMRWLVRLVTPLGGTVLDPFAGSGTTGAAALAEGRNAILIEREPEYFADIERRMAAAALTIAA